MYTWDGSSAAAWTGKQPVDCVEVETKTWRVVSGVDFFEWGKVLRIGAEPGGQALVESVVENLDGC